MIKEILLPDIGEGIDGASVSEVSVSVGDIVGSNDTILVLESDKSSMEIPADVNGRITEITVSAGDELKPGHVLMKVELSADAPKDSLPIKEQPQIEPQSPPPSPTEITEPNPRPEGLSVGTTALASPGVRRLARELGISLNSIKGSGQKNRITKNDLNNYIKLQMAISSRSIPAQNKEIDFSKWGRVEIQKLTRVNRITGQRLQRAWQTIPHVTQFDNADITDLDLYRKKLKKQVAEKGIKVTFLPFLIRAASIVLKEMPEFNSSLDHTGQNLVLKNYFHLGIAVDTPSGLTVPVVKDVNKKRIIDLSSELMDLSSRARENKLKPDEMKGGTFTISSLGGIGGTGFSPIVNPPEVAIMGISRSGWKQVYDKETEGFKTRFIMPFSLSYDHRVIDGASAAIFTSRFASVFSDISHFKN
jgi:pyruvate dehydrogenase E2 component (dihydrolipoamide acetyltransferase)